MTDFAWRNQGDTQTEQYTHDSSKYTTTPVASEKQKTRKEQLQCR